MGYSGRYLDATDWSGMVLYNSVPGEPNKLSAVEKHRGEGR